MRLIPIPKNRGMKSDDQFNIAVESAEKTMTRRASSTRLFFFHFLDAYFDIDPPHEKDAWTPNLNMETKVLSSEDFYSFFLFSILLHDTRVLKDVSIRRFFFVFCLIYGLLYLQGRPLWMRYSFSIEKQSIFGSIWNETIKILVTTIYKIEIHQNQKCSNYITTYCIL